MVYDFITTIEQLPQNKRKKALKDLTDTDMKVLEHIYLNKKMLTKDEVKTRLYDTAYSTKKVITLLDLIERASILPELTLDEVDILCQDILVYMHRVVMYDKSESKKCAGVLFRQRKIVGIKANDVKEELEKRKIKVRKN